MALSGGVAGSVVALRGGLVAVVELGSFAPSLKRSRTLLAGVDPAEVFCITRIEGVNTLARTTGDRLGRARHDREHEPQGQLL